MTPKSYHYISIHSKYIHHILTNTSTHSPAPNVTYDSFLHSSFASWQYSNIFFSSATITNTETTRDNSLSISSSITFRYFRDQIKVDIQTSVCEEVTKIVSGDYTKKLQSLKMLAKLNHHLTLDYSMDKQPVFGPNFIKSFHKGNFVGDAVVLPVCMLAVCFRLFDIVVICKISWIFIIYYCYY